MELSDLERALKDSEELKRLFKNCYDLVKTAKAFPNHAEELIGRVLLKDPEELKRLFYNDGYDLREAAKVFPNHADILGQKSIEAAIKVSH